MLNLSNLKSQKGISLVEVLVTLAVAVMMIVAIVAVILVSLKNSQFAQNQMAATKYAQEAMDKVKAVRDRDSVVIRTGGLILTKINTPACTPVSDISKFSDLYCFYLSSNGSDCQIKGGCYLKGEALSREPSPEDLDRGLKREVLIKDDSTTANSEKVIKVRVYWEDSSGIHESDLETVLINTR